MWFAVRIAFVLFFTIPSLQGAWGNAQFPSLMLSFNVIIIVVAFFFIVGLWQMRSILKKMIKGKQNSNKPVIFYKPSWHLNPFLKNEAYQFMHMGCMAFLISGLTGLGRYFLVSFGNNSAEWIIPAFLTLVSLAWLSGMYINILLNKDKFRVRTK